MSSEVLKERIADVLKLNRIGVLSTIKDNRPYARYMTFHHEGFTLFTPTAEDTHKVEDIEDNPYVHILLGYEESERGEAFIEVEAEAEIATDPGDRKKAWSEKVAEKYSGPDDDRFIVLVCRPFVIRYRNDDDPEAAQEIHL
ncbi:pyridoxamine 5'-phosphate oxidase family protein [Salicibibacter kimchii]|uniref:General stress protein n=1 Tax=Salicibibacter kimchii TaxID=2099786 RepID=A0A345BZN3_9BACI|nr:pyridoxamine 5'-phosphate oxidase family protein [Salicibibacter kimchii]AXF56414.1 general stress protein [Salicibibacter kimchii]